MKKHREGWGCVYMMRNLINGKRNVGYDSTGDPENHRWKHHKNTALKTSDRRPLYRALRKAYKRDKCWDGFEFSVIWRGPVELLREKEIYYIRKHRSFIDDLLGDRSYNLTKGGDGVAVPSKRTKNKISTTLKVYCASNVVKKQLSVQSKKAWLNPEMRAKQVEVNGRLLVTSKDRARHGQRIKRGMKKSGASKKVSIAQTLLWADEDYRKHQIKCIRKGSLKPEVRARRSATATRLSNDPIWQAKRVATMKLTLAKPGAKERASKAAKESLARPDVKKKMSRASKRRMAIPGAKKHISDVVKAWWTPERRAAQAERARVNGLKRGGLNVRRNH